MSLELCLLKYSSHKYLKENALLDSVVFLFIVIKITVSQKDYRFLP
jgi:hypothetical protein